MQCKMIGFMCVCVCVFVDGFGELKNGWGKENIQKTLTQFWNKNRIHINAKWQIKEKKTVSYFILAMWINKSMCNVNL